MDAGRSIATVFQGLLGYLNYSTGRSDPRVQAQFFTVWETVAGRPSPRLAVLELLNQVLLDLHAAGNAAFKDMGQVQAVLDLALRQLPAAYRRHHEDLLAHQSDLDLFQAGFMLRCVEAVLCQQGPWEEADRIVAGALKQLNDYVGHRPVAVLETGVGKGDEAHSSARPEGGFAKKGAAALAGASGEPYDHEKLRPVPLYVRGAGVAPGRYAPLVTMTLDLLRAVPAGLQADACFEFAHLDELAFDPRAYDHNHPADRRPNYRFGEWDPHHIDNGGFYRRFVVRQTVLDGLLERINNTDPAAATGKGVGNLLPDFAPRHESEGCFAQKVPDPFSGSLPAEERLHEAATVLAGTVLMASGISGAGPDTHDSSVNLATLMPRIARYRDAFYNQQLGAILGSHGERLRQEAKAMRQPFGGARQHINQYLALQRAAQLQQRRLALLIAELGYPDAARRHAARVPAASLRMLAEIHIHLTTCQILADGRKGDRHLLPERPELDEAAGHLEKAEEVLHRAIACGAMVDPWNILGFQGIYPLFTAMEDSVRDQRIDELVNVVDRLLTLYAHLRSEAAAAGNAALGIRLATKMERLAQWWDRFASTSVNEIRHVLGRETAASAEHVAEALTRWRQLNKPEASATEEGKTSATGAPAAIGGNADLAFWRENLDQFRSAKSFALVVEELLRRNDYRAAMALLMSWLSQADQVPLQDGDYSFHVLALRWMLGIVGSQETAAPLSPEKRGVEGFPDLIRKFIDHLEANAEDYWQVPKLGLAGDEEQLPMPRQEDDDEEEEALFGAAYEGMTYHDSADDGTEGELLGFEPRQEFELEREGEQLEGRLRFLSTVARLFHIGSRSLAHGPGRTAGGATREVIEGWLARARRNYQDLLVLMDAIHQRPIPSPSGSYDSLVEFDRRHFIKQRLLTVVVSACLEWALAVGSMLGVVGGKTKGTGGEKGLETKRPRWEPSLLQLEHALWQSDAATAHRVLPKFLEHFQHEPLLFTPMAQGGNPRLILRATIAQTLLRALVANLPRLGLLRETYSVLRVAQTMEQEQKLQGPRVTEFDRLYQIACQASIEAAVASVNADESLSPAERVHLLGRLIEPYLSLWAEHSKTVRLSVLETVASDGAWAGLRDFIRKYGSGLFHARFMTLGNLRGILQRGVGAYLMYLEQNPDPQNPVGLIDDLDRRVPRADAEQYLQVVLQAVVENYEEYKDYNTTTPQSDYGENLYTLLDFLRLKGAYGRQAWLLRPLSVVHEVLVKHSNEGAILWQQQVKRLTSTEAEKYVAHLAELEKAHGMRLRTVSDRVGERFVQPLALDRVCAFIEPAFEEARVPGRGALTPALEKLEEGLRPYLDTPSGAGLDVPVWLGRLEAELQRVQMRRTAIANLAENLLQVPRLIVPVANLREQLQDWPKP